MIKNQFGVNIKRLLYDNEKEYFNHVLTSFVQKEGIVYESSCCFITTKWNCRKKKWASISPNPNTIVLSKHSKIFMGEAVLTSTYLINRLPSRVLWFKSPMDVTFSFNPNLLGKNFKEDKLESLDLSGLESNTLNLSSTKSNASGHLGHDSNSLNLSHSGHDLNIPNLSDLESNPLDSSSFESNRPNLSGLELNTLVPEPSEAEEVGVESN
ncbi:hypothetical protein KIW84_044806 [Lathyrus oleraceus]|uniref:Uncharacterized protein n=1 Tax=Pisum sativum TaxID=3888 RepID=A0A9D5AVU8_PEA|nr:hypothetical protein KIW84_044806 [Pisum sativum]